MDGPIQNVFPCTKWMAPTEWLPNILNRWPHTECFAKHAKWMAPYRMHGWPHTVCFSKHTKWMAPYRMFFQTY